MAHALRTIVTRQADIRLTESNGPGLPVLMLHGSSASRRVFDREVMGPVAERHRVIALDFPGHGESSDARDPARDYTIPGFAECVAEVLAALNVGELVVFGWSLGGHVAIELMHRHAGIKGLMLMGCPPVPRGPLGMLRAFHTNWDMFLASKEHYTPRDIERYAYLCYGEHVPSELVDAVRRADGRFRPILARAMMRGEGADQKHTVEQTPIPVAIVSGEHDPIVRQGFYASLNIPNLWDGHLHVLEGAGHAAFRDQPERFDALLMRFAADAEAWQAPRVEIAKSA